MAAAIGLAFLTLLVSGTPPHDPCRFTWRRFPQPCSAGCRLRLHRKGIKCSPSPKMVLLHERYRCRTALQRAEKEQAASLSKLQAAQTALEAAQQQLHVAQLNQLEAEMERDVLRSRLLALSLIHI